ncbi:BTB/POZ domain-containing protein At5g60050 [Linum perenne]
MASSKEVSSMIRQGFISDQARVFGSPNSKTLLSPPPSTSNADADADAGVHHPTLFQMMSEEQALEQFRHKSHSKVSNLLREFQGLSGMGMGDVRVTVVGIQGHKISIDVHKRVLVDKSGFFREKLSGREKGVMHSVEIISEFDDVEIYLEALLLMYYSHDLNKRLLGQQVSKVLALLKVSAAIMFEVGITACLEYLEAVPWSEDEEGKIISHLSELDLLDPATEALQRVSCQLSISSEADDIFLKLLNGVLQAKDEKARREMKALLSRLFRTDSSDNENKPVDVSKETLYSLCQRCINSLIACLTEATCIDDSSSRPDRGALMSEIAREADNLHWIVDILINKKLGEDFVKLWADQKELASLHSKIPTMYRHEISKITAQLCIGIGRGEIMVAKESRFALLSNWLEALYEDFGWMKRASRTVDKKLVEDGIGQTILTLPLLQQQGILLNWFDRFLNKGDDCPNIQTAFEVWWRRAFIRQYSHQTTGNSKLQVTVCDYPN